MKFTDQKISSSNLEALTYDGDSEELIIEFKDGGRYAYDKVPKKIIEAFLEDQSKGKFFHANIKSKYDYKKISSRSEKEIEDALKVLYGFFDSMHYLGEREVANIQRGEKGNINISMKKPEGFFIVRTDGYVEDNYGIFEE